MGAGVGPGPSVVRPLQQGAPEVPRRGAGADSRERPRRHRHEPGRRIVPGARRLQHGCARLGVLKVPGVEQAADHHRVEVAGVPAHPAGEDGVGPRGFPGAQRRGFREQQRPQQGWRAESRVEAQRLLDEGAEIREARRSFQPPAPVVLDGEKPRGVGQEAPNRGGKRRDLAVAEVRTGSRGGDFSFRPRHGRDPGGHPETQERQAGAGETAGADATDTSPARVPHPSLQEAGAAGWRARHGNTAIAAATIAAAYRMA